MSEKYIQTQTPATLNISPILKEKQSNLSFQKPFALINKHDYNFKQQILESSQIFNSDLQSPKKQKKLKKITIEKKEKDIQNIVDYKDYKPSCMCIIKQKYKSQLKMYHPKTTEIDQYKSDYQKSIDNLESLKVHHYHLENYDPTIKNINIYNKNQSQLDSMFGLSLLQRMGSKQELSYGINKLREHFKKDAQKYANYNGKKYYQIMSNQELDTKENRTSLIYQMKNFKSALDMEVGQKKIKIKQFAEHQIEEKQQKIEEKVNLNLIIQQILEMQGFIYDNNKKEKQINHQQEKQNQETNTFFIFKRKNQEKKIKQILNKAQHLFNNKLSKKSQNYIIEINIQKIIQKLDQLKNNAQQVQKNQQIQEQDENQQEQIKNTLKFENQNQNLKSQKKFQTLSKQPQITQTLPKFNLTHINNIKQTYKYLFTLENLDKNNEISPQSYENQIKKFQKKIKQLNINENSKDSETSILSGHTDHIYMEDSSENSISDDSNKDFSQLNDFNQNVDFINNNNFQIETQVNSQNQTFTENSNYNNKQLQNKNINQCINSNINNRSNHLLGRQISLDYSNFANSKCKNRQFNSQQNFPSNSSITCLKFNHYQNTQEKNNIEIQQQQQKNQNSSENNKQLQKLVHQQNLPLDKIIYYLQEDIKLDPKSFNKQFLRQRKSQIIQKTDRSKLQINKNNQNNFENSRSSISSDSVDKKQKQLNQLNSPKNCSILYQSNKNLNFPNLKQNRHSFPLISGISNSQLKSKISKNFQQQNKNDVNIKQQEQKQIKNISKTFLSQRLVKDDNENDENQKQNLNNSKKVNKRNKSTTYRGTTQLYHVIPKNLITAQDVQFFQNLKKKQEEKQNKKLSHLSLDKSLLNNLKLSKSSLSTAVSNIETSNLKNLLQKQSKMLQKYHNNQSQTNCNKNNLINQSQLQSSSPYFSSYSDFASANQCSIIQQNPKNQNLINMLCSPNSNQNNGNSLFSLKYLDFETPTSQKNEQDYMILDKKNTPCCSFCKKPYNQSTKQQKFFITKKNSYKNK